MGEDEKAVDRLAQLAGIAERIGVPTALAMALLWFFGNHLSEILAQLSAQREVLHEILVAVRGLGR